MSPSKNKRKGKQVQQSPSSTPPTLEHLTVLSDHSRSSDEESSDDEPVTQEYLDSLLQKANENLSAKARGKRPVDAEDDVLVLDEDSEPPLPSLNPGPSLPRPYFSFTGDKADDPRLVRDVDQEKVETEVNKIGMKIKAPEVTRPKKTMKREKKEEKALTAGPDWYDLPAPPASSLPALAREVEALRLRNALDPKRFYRKDASSSKGRGGALKNLPRHFAIGTIVSTPTPFSSNAGGENLTKAQRKRSIVDELVEDSEIRSRTKRKFVELQGVRGERGRGTLRRKLEKRKPKW